MITIEESTQRLRAVTASISDNPMTLTDMHSVCLYLAAQESLAKETGADKLICAWTELRESLEYQFRVANIGLHVQ